MTHKPAEQIFHFAPRRGLTLVELLIAVGIMGLMAAALGTLAMAVQASSEYSQGHGSAVQHARVALQRIQQACRSAAANADFPGFWVITQRVGGYGFPDTLVVWKPSAAAAGSMPLFSELVVFCFDPDTPTRLLELTVPDDNRPVPPLNNAAAWASELDSLKSSDSANKVQLTNLMRAADAGAGNQELRGVVRFDVRYRPGLTEWSDYQAGSLAWKDMLWPQNLYGSQFGLRQSWCSIEMQLVPAGKPATGAEAQSLALPFFDSAALYYPLQP